MQYSVLDHDILDGVTAAPDGTNNMALLDNVNVVCMINGVFN